MKRIQSEKLYGEACRYMPGGVSSPVRAFRSVGGTPLYIKKGSGSRITDQDGNQFIDYCMSWGPLILGHADSDVVRAVIETAPLGTSFGTPHENEVILARMIREAFPSMEKLRFVNSGTEATMSAIRAARGFTGRSRFIKFDGCYHGHADSLLVAAGSGCATLGEPDSAGVTKGAAQDTIVLPFNDIEAIDSYCKAEGETVAAVIMEPVPCNYGLILPDHGYLEKVRAICDRYGIVLIFDEVITGLRLSHGGAQELFSVKPDMTTLGKIIGGGLPVGAYGGRAEIMSKIAPDGPVYQAGTLSGNPLAMASGIAALTKLASPHFYEDLEKKGSLLEQLMAPVCAQHKGKILFSRIGSVFSFTFTELERIRTVTEIKKADMKLYAAFHAGMLKKGIYLAPSGYEVGFLSSAHSNDDIEETVRAAEEVIENIL